MAISNGCYKGVKIRTVAITEKTLLSMLTAYDPSALAAEIMFGQTNGDSESTKTKGCPGTSKQLYSVNIVANNDSVSNIEMN